MEDKALEHYTYNVYQDMKTRTGGQLYIGVVGPVRTGKSTFIKRFMDLCILPNIEDKNEALRARDELPQSGEGKTVTTTEPKFIPKEAAEVVLDDGVNMKIRLIDCVGYMVDGAVGHMEEGKERMVKTPWFDETIPFTKAAETGTTKVIEDHATVGLVITADGSFGELSREAYLAAEGKTMETLRREHKPYMMLLNSAKPYSEETVKMAVENPAIVHFSTSFRSYRPWEDGENKHPYYGEWAGYYSQVNSTFMKTDRRIVDVKSNVFLALVGILHVYIRPCLYLFGAHA